MNKTDIVNGALNLLGIREVTTIDEDTNEGRIARRYYDTALKAVLGNTKWKITVKTIYPNLLPNEPSQRNFKYVYQIDSTVFKIITVYDKNKDIVQNQTEYEIVGNRLYSSLETLSIEATYQIPEEDFTAMMTEAMILKLGSLMSTALTGPTTGLREQLNEQYEDTISMGVNEVDYEVDYRNRQYSMPSRRTNVIRRGNYDVQK